MKRTEKEEKWAFRKVIKVQFDEGLFSPHELVSAFKRLETTTVGPVLPSVPTTNVRVSPSLEKRQKQCHPGQRNKSFN